MEGSRPGTGSRRPRSRRWLAIYVVVQCLLLTAAIVMRDPTRSGLYLLVFVVGTLTLTASVARRQPRPAAAWWLVVAATWASLASASVIAAWYGFASGASINSLGAVLLTTVPLPVLAAGLAVLTRSVARSGRVDGLDAAMTSLAGFILFWTFAIEPVLAGTLASWAAAVVLPAGILLVVSLSVRIVLGGGARDPATALLLGSVALQVVSAGTSLTPAEAAALRSTPVGAFTWAAYGLVLGAVGLLPALTRERVRPQPATTDVSRGRLALFAVLALVPIVACAWELIDGEAHRHSLAGSLVPVVVSAAFLPLLIARLAMLARLAQRRYTELLRQTRRQQVLQEQLAYQAAHDPLTGLANRTALTEHLDQASAEPRGPSALMMLDIDSFKTINDQFGHQVGDELLVGVADRLRAAAPAGAVVARLGGDEFVIVAHDVDRRAARSLADHVVAQMRGGHLTAAGQLHITTSAGVVSLPADDATAYAQALRNADRALYAAKAEGKDRVVLR